MYVKEICGGPTELDRNPGALSDTLLGARQPASR